VDDTSGNSAPRERQQNAACDRNGATAELSQTSSQCESGISNTLITIADMTITRCLQLMEVSWNLKLLLEKLEISWNLVDVAGKFCN